MINAREDLSKKHKKCYLNIFQKKEILKYLLLEIAIHLKQVSKIIPHIKFLKKLGYFIILNLMQIDKVSSKDLIKSIKLIKKNKSLSVFYFADSFGSLKPSDVKISNIIKRYWNKEFGFHAHDNCGLALQNALTAIKYGAKWIDSTIQGMGRGAGNVTTEDLLCEINDIYKLKYNLSKNLNYLKINLKN